VKLVTNFKLEVACFNFESALIAAQSGADRIELCENYSEGGITPGVELIQKVKSQIKIPVHVMIRQRGGNFICSDSEFEKMKTSIEQCGNSGVDGVVFGILDENKLIDKKRCAQLVELAKPMGATFHRAFDEVENSFIALEEIIDCGFDRILTSGQKQTAIEGAELISEWTQQANGRIIIMPGGGVRSENIFELLNTTGAKEFHSSAINIQSILPDKNEIMTMKELLSL
jgi:copper homeostasis protein